MDPSNSQRSRHSGAKGWKELGDGGKGTDRCQGVSLFNMKRSCRNATKKELEWVLASTDAHRPLRSNSSARILQEGAGRGRLRVIINSNEEERPRKEPEKLRFGRRFVCGPGSMSSGTSALCLHSITYMPWANFYYLSEVSTEYWRVPVLCGTQSGCRTHDRRACPQGARTFKEGREIPPPPPGKKKKREKKKKESSS